MPFPPNASRYTLATRPAEQRPARTSGRTPCGILLSAVALDRRHHRSHPPPPPPKSSNSKSCAWNRRRSRAAASARSAPTTGSSRARPSRCRRMIRTTAIIVDLDRAPRNAQGLVEAVTDVEILRPTVAANGNRRLFYEALNRGNKLGLALFNDSPAVVNDLAKATDAGNGFLMNRGYTHRVERLAGRRRAGRRAHDVLAAGRARGDRSGARGFHLRPHRQSRQRDAELSRRRSRSGACQNQRAPARGRSARDARRPGSSNSRDRTKSRSGGRMVSTPARSTNSSTPPRTPR